MSLVKLPSVFESAERNEEKTRVDYIFINPASVQGLYSTSRKTAPYVLVTRICLSHTTLETTMPIQDVATLCFFSKEA